MKRLIIHIAFLVSVTFSVYGQQDAHYTHYMYNGMVMNPAEVGTSGMLHAGLFHKSQWVLSDFEDMSINFQSFSIDKPFTGKNMAAGLYLQNDKVGLTKNVIAQGAFAYKLILGSGDLNMGLNAGIRYFSVDFGDLYIKDVDDAVFADGPRSPIVPDFGLGFKYTHAEGKYYAGLSVLHLHQPRINFSPSKADNAKLRRQYFLYGGYKYEINMDWLFTPSVRGKFVNGAPMQFDFTMMTVYQEKAWAGLNYRTGDAVAFLLGVNVDQMGLTREKIKVGYAFDLSVSRVPKFNSGGSHEVFITYDFTKGEAQHIPKFKKLE